MPDSNENETMPGWVKGDLPEETQEAAEAPLGEESSDDTGRPTPDAAEVIEAEAENHLPAPEPPPDVSTELGVEEVDPLVQAEMQDMVSDVAALVESTFEAAPAEADQAVVNLVEAEPPATPEELAVDTAEPLAVAVVVEAELQAEALAEASEASAGPPATNTLERPAEDSVEAPVDDSLDETRGPGGTSEGQDMPVTSEAELAIESQPAGQIEGETAAQTVPPSAEADEPSEAEEPTAEVERPIADGTVAEAAAVEEQLPPAPTEAEPAGITPAEPTSAEAEKPKKRGRKAREPKTLASVAAALESLSQPGQVEPADVTTLGPALSTVPLGLEALVESLLFVADGAVPVARLAEALEIQPREVEAALASLAESYQHRGLSLQRFRDRVQLTTSPTAAPLVERFLGLAASSPLSRAALEALAIVAYQQPVTRPQIEAVRGVNSDSVIKNLLTKGLIEESGRAEGPGRPVLYSTTTEFMQHFGLAALTDLPPLTPPTAETPTDTISELLKG